MRGEERGGGGGGNVGALTDSNLRGQRSATRVQSTLLVSKQLEEPTEINQEADAHNAAAGWERGVVVVGGVLEPNWKQAPG